MSGHTFDRTCKLVPEEVKIYLSAFQHVSLSMLFFLGPDCSLTVPSTESFWILPSVKPFGTSLARASHKVVVQEKVMWVVGGYTFNYSAFQMILK